MLGLCINLALLQIETSKMNNIVYSTKPGWKNNCKRCGLAKGNCVCEKRRTNTFKNQTAYVKRDRKGRGGKTVTVISNLSGDIKSLQKELQKKCASGSALKNSTLEIQGDHINKIRTILEEKGCKVKQIGG